MPLPTFFSLKHASPRQLSLFVAIVASMALSLVAVVVFLLTLGHVPWTAVLLLVLVFFPLMFTLVRVSTETFVYRKIKLVYKTIHRLKARSPEDPGLLTRIRAGGDVIGQVNEEVIAWANRRRAEIEELKTLESYRRDFIGNLSHELKTPIATVSLACQGLLSKDIVLNEAQRNRYVGIIEQENQRLLNLVESVLQANSLSKGKLILDKTPINLVEVIQNVVESSVLRVEAKKGTIEFLYNPKEFYTFVADKNHLTNAIYNLLDNAIKYSQGNLQIKIILSKLKNGYVLHIQDNGIGIDRVYHKKIFEKLYRVPTGNIHETTGYGLGLSYVKYIVDMHQGKIWLDSELNKGTTFFVRLYN